MAWSAARRGWIGGDAAGSERLYTTPEELLEVAGTLGTGERGRYLLAATFGNVHGVYAPGQVKLRPEILGDGQRALERAHPGARFQYVFHGSSGSTPDELRAAVRNGVVKVNLDSRHSSRSPARRPSTWRPTATAGERARAR